MLDNVVVTEVNRSWIVESLRAIAEIVIWGDQNDPAVFEFFMEKVLHPHVLHVLPHPHHIISPRQIIVTLL